MNKFLLIACALAGVMLGQEPHKIPASTPLKEYLYASDGFAIKFPYAPEPHTDATQPDFKVWTVHLSQRAALSIRTMADSLPCDVALDRLKSMAKYPIREFSVSGRPAWEVKAHLRGDMMSSERYVCGVGRYYFMSFAWPASESRPQLGTEIMDSFRLVK